MSSGPGGYGSFRPAATCSDFRFDLGMIFLMSYILVHFFPK